MITSSNLFKISIGTVRIEFFVSPHKRDQIFGIAQIYDIMSIPGEHMHCGRAISVDLELHNRIVAYPAFFD